MGFLVKESSAMVWRGLMVSEGIVKAAIEYRWIISSIPTICAIA